MLSMERSARQPSSMWARVADGAFGGGDHLPDRGAVAGAEVPGVHAGVVGEAAQRCEVAPCEIDDVDVVADAGAVGRVVVVAEDRQLLELAHCDLHDERHQIVRQPRRVLADAAALVGTDRIEVPQEAHSEAIVGGRCGAQDALDHLLGVAIGVGRPGRCVLVQRHGCCGAVHRGRRREHQAAHPGCGHGLGQRDRGTQVDAEVAQRFGDGLADGLEAGEVDDAIDGIGVEHRFEAGPVGDVELDEGDFASGDVGHGVERLDRAVGQIVHDNDVVARQQ
jgi:hypothetical protein